MEKQLKKTGGSAFYAKELQIEMGENLFLPVSALNELRRDALDRLWEKLCQKGKRTLSERTGQNACPDSGCKSDASSGQRKEPLLYASALLAEQALALLDEAGVRRLYVNADLLFAKEEERLMEKAAKRQEADEGFELFLQLPALLRSYSEPYLAALAQKVRPLRTGSYGILAGSGDGDVLGKGGISGEKAVAAAQCLCIQPGDAVLLGRLLFHRYLYGAAGIKQAGASDAACAEAGNGSFTAGRR